VSVHQPLPPGCEPACHGCRHRGWSPEASLEQKYGYLARVLAPWGDRLAPVHSVPPQQWLGYRDRVTLTARWSAEAGWQFGLVRRDELIVIHECPVHTARVNGLVRLLVEALPPCERFALAYLHVCGPQATLIVKSRHWDPAALEGVVAKLPASGIEGLWVHCHPAAGRRMFARSGWTLAWGQGESRDSQGLVHGPTSFQQLLPELHGRSVELAAEYLAPGPARAVLDLYCGIGATLRRWTAAQADALGIELSGGAVDCAGRNAPAATVLRGTCNQRLPQIRAWWTGRGHRPAAYVNPPRSGLEPEVAHALARELRPTRIAYLSCSAGTLARDLAGFEAAGYRIDALHPFDFFPLTHHVEVLALLACA
jgi:23S rRNA (uracil1939-C5)-methyltransferase